MMNKLNSYKNTSISEEKNVSNKISASNQIVGVENSSFNYLNDKKYDRDYKNSIVTFQLAKANEVVPNVQNVVSTVSLGQSEFASLSSSALAFPCATLPARPLRIFDEVSASW